MNTTAQKPHALFLQHEGHQWTGPLPDLFARLVAEAKKNAGPFAWRVLRGGAVVGVRLHPEHARLELRIARTEPPADQQADAKWQHEIGTFLRYFGITPVDGSTPAESDSDHWLALPKDQADRGKAAARYLQLRRGEVSVGKSVCHLCRKAGVATPVDWFPGGGLLQLCGPHVGEASRAYTEAVLRRTRPKSPPR